MRLRRAAPEFCWFARWRRIYKDNKTIDLSEQYQERLGEYCVALQERDFAQALELASACEKIATKWDEPKKLSRPAFKMKALACELLGDWAAASENYENAASLGDRRDALEEA